MVEQVHVLEVTIFELGDRIDMQIIDNLEVEEEREWVANLLA